MKAAACASPSGKRNSFASNVRAEHILAERGNAQPRTLANAFVQPVAAGDQMRLSTERLNRQRNAFASVYGADWDAESVLDIHSENSATLDQIAGFCSADLPAVTA